MTVFDQASPAVLIASLVAGIALAFGAFRMFPKKKKFRQVGKVESLMIYPIKSCKGIRLEEAECSPLGLKTNHGLLDRHWALSTSTGTLISQRMEPTMALIEPSVNGSIMTLKAPGMEPISFEAFPEPNEINQSKINIFSEDFSSVDVGDAIGDWLSSYLKRDGVRLHFSAPAVVKKDFTSINKGVKRFPAKPGDVSAFSDVCGYMILSNKSIDYINSKLEKPVTLLTFRPNILVDVTEAFAEDAWYTVRIGDATLRALEYCTRCVLTTVIPETGKKDENGEPLATLRKYRSKEGYGNSPCFGMLHTLENAGTIKVGDPVYAIDG